MDETATNQTAVEVGRILDALAALSVDIECHGEIPDDKLILPAKRVRQTCAAIREAVTALKAILAITEESGGGIIPVDIQRRLDRAE